MGRLVGGCVCLSVAVTIPQLLFVCLPCRLQCCQITSAGCRDLATALSTSLSLQELHLGDNDVGDAGVHLLCKGLKHPSCQLEKLQ